MGALHIEGLRAGYGDDPDVLADVDLDVRPGEVVALLGASGSGKSTLLRCVAGLHPLRAGTVTIDGTDVAEVPVERRGVGLVFQDHALFPHRDVAGNVAFGPRMQGDDPATVAQRVRHALAGVGLGDLADRAVDELSGGEQQRVALARALAARPRLLLLDEPYGSLDRPLRERLAAELPGIVRADGVGALLVTHDQQEALRAADRLAVLIGGRVRQVGPPAQLWRDPVDAAVAAFLGVGPLLDGEVHDGVFHGVAGTLPVVDAPDGPARLLVPTAALRPATDRDTSTLRCTVEDARFGGDHQRIEARLADGTRAVVRLHGPEPLPDPGTTLHLAVDVTALRTFPHVDVTREGTAPPDGDAQ